MQYSSYINRRTSKGFDRWHDQTCRQFSTTECDIQSEPDFSGSVTSWEAGALRFGELSAKTRDRHLPLVRDEADIRRDPRDHIMLFQVQSGEVGFQQSERNTTAKPGDLVLYDQATPFTVDFMGNTRGLVVAVPRSEAISRLATVDRLTARRLPGSSQASRFAASILKQFCPSEDEEKPNISRKVESSALDLIFGSIEQCLHPHETAIEHYRQKQLQGIKQYILGNLHDPDLNIENICAAQGVSPRSLNRAFSSEGTTPIRWLWKKRLEGSYTVITQGKFVSITEVAYEFGFRDVSHFSRAFKSEFGRTPSSLLRRS